MRIPVGALFGIAGAAAIFGLLHVAMRIFMRRCDKDSEGLEVIASWIASWAAVGGLMGGFAWVAIFTLGLIWGFE